MSSSQISSYVPDDQLPETTLPLVNSYEYFAKKPSAFSVKGVRELIKPSSNRKVMEYVQSSKFSSCQQQGYTNLHFGVVRIGLTLHARKSLPVIARIALIDSRLKSYQQACAGTVQTTLNAGTIFIKLFPNFNVSLQDPNLLKTLKVQLQLIGAPMQEKSIAATLHHQIVYRIQDPALDLVLPSSDEALYLEVTSASQAPNSIQIPRQISREELIRRLPESWVTSYEKLHQATQSPVQSSEVSFHSRKDGTTAIKFEKPRSSSFRKQLFTQFAIQVDEQDFYGPAKKQDIPKPCQFGKNGEIIYPFIDEDGHCRFDVCNCTACSDAFWSYESDDENRSRRQKKKDPLYKRYLEGNPSVGPLGDGKYDFIVEYSEKRNEPSHEVLMISPNNFPPQEDFIKDNVAHIPKILSAAVGSSGPTQLSQAEKVLNWQTENSLAQNHLLSTINQKVDQLKEGFNKTQHSLQNSITEIHGRLNNLHQELMTMAKHMMVDTTQFRNKEVETASLKSQLRDLQRSLESMIHNQRQKDSYFNPFGSTSSEVPIYQGSYSPGFLSGYQTQKTRSPLPGFISSDEVFTSGYGSTSIFDEKLKQPKSKTRRQKGSEF
ncbi:hypothetical protein Bca52824_022756 [Brassica carinata]|uniref:Uncharacterized protein n=1 Tax=Brassica carinata TaxID=52824 RepID=A0A8X8ARR9_BRACI|nr:hypothetical protein Bca52824_022756 [Brassica carinata]